MFAAILAFILDKVLYGKGGKCIMENQKALKKVSDKDLRKVFLHSLAIMCSWEL